MRGKLTSMLLLGTAIMLTGPSARSVLATPASGFTGTTIALGRFSEFTVFNHLIPPDFWKSRHESDIWLSWQKTKGNSDVYVQSNVWAPGAHTGWHSHPGHSLIIVTAGTLTAYEGDDRRCRPHQYSQGMGFVDEGGDHVHIIRNEGTVEARGIAVQLIPADATRRIDVPAPGNCAF